MKDCIIMEPICEDLKNGDIIQLEKDGCILEFEIHEIENLVEENRSKLYGRYMNNAYYSV